MPNACFISVILPLKLEWEPYYLVPQEMLPIQTGDRVKVIFAGKEYIGVTDEVNAEPGTDFQKIKSICCIEHGIERVLPQEIDLWRQVSGYYLCSIGEVYKAAYPLGKINLEEAKAKAEEKSRLRLEKQENILRGRLEKLRERLENKRAQIAKARKDSTREAYESQADNIQSEISRTEELLSTLASDEEYSPNKNLPINESPELSTAQGTALRAIRHAFSEDKPALIQGITGSGKTEIYISLALDCLNSGRNVLYLVPEIALSRQLEDRLYSYFGERLLTFHSAISAAGKREIAENIRKAEAGNNYIVLGTRSALFLPHNELGLIVIDEEHDRSYKQDSPAPRYHGRDTALMLAKIHNSKVVLGSATPSLESLYNCRSGKHLLVELNERFHGSENSDIEIIDTRAERRKRGMRGNFSIKLIEHIKNTLSLGEQVIILRSRRAYSPALQCQECGEVQKCPHCNVSYSLHRQNSGKPEGSKVICHHCGWSAPFQNKCTCCGGELALLGAGTQKIEEEAAILFPEARIARLDSDTAQNKSYEAQTIKEFSKGNIDILIGTQIISKGFDFSNLSLVSIISSDTLLAIQDFRADEKAIQLMEQLRGRCGRRGNKGKFIIQTSQAEHPIYQHLLNNNLKSFSQTLMQERKDFAFPPYSRIINICIKDIYEDRVQRMGMALASLLRLKLNDVTGPYAPSPDKIADQYLRHIRISLPKDRNLTQRKSILKECINKFEKEKKYPGHISIDVDPS